MLINISLNNVNQQIVRDSLQKLSASTNEILGLVANNVKEPMSNPASSGKYYYQYQYNYQNKYFPLENKFDNSNNELSENEFSQKGKIKNLIISTKKLFKDLKKNLFNWINE